MTLDDCISKTALVGPNFVTGQTARATPEVATNARRFAECHIAPNRHHNLLKQTMMQEFNMVNGGSIGNKIAPGIVEPSIGKPTYLNRDNDLLVEQYVTSLDNKLDQATKNLAKAEEEAKLAQDLAKKQAEEFATAKEAWEKEKEELTSQLSQLQMRQAQKATDEFNAYWDNKKKQAEEDSSSAAAALIKAEGHIKSLQETNANLCYRLSEMRSDMAKLEAAAAAQD